MSNILLKLAISNSGILSKVPSQLIQRVPDISSFIFTVKTDNTGTSNSDQFTVPTLSSGTYNSYVDWGDGSAIEHLTAYDDAGWTHTFAEGAGTYTVRIWGTLEGWSFNNGGDKSKITKISQWSILDGIQQGGFYGCDNLSAITATDYPRFLTSAVAADLNSLFFSCTSLTYIPNVENWTAPNASNLSAMFRDVPINQNISKIITSNISVLNNFIRGSNIDQDLSAGDFSGVTAALNFALDTNMSTANYDALLVSLGGQSLQSGLSIHFGNATYSGYSAAGTAHTKLRNQYSWSITDGGANIHADTIRWYDAYDETTITDVAGAVSQWDDKSAVGDDAVQASSGDEPLTGTTTINSRNTLLFDGSNDNLDLSDIDFVDKSIFLVIKPNTSSSTRQLISNSTATNTQLRIDSSNVLSVASTTNNWISGGGPGNVLSTFAIAEESAVVGFTGGVKLGFIKNSSYETVGIDRVNTNAFAVNQMGLRQAALDPYGGDIAEIIILSSVASAGDIADITDYLIEKWGIA